MRQYLAVKRPQKTDDDFNFDAFGLVFFFALLAIPAMLILVSE